MGRDEGMLDVEWDGLWPGRNVGDGDLDRSSAAAMREARLIAPG